MDEIYQFCHLCDRLTVHKREHSRTPYTCREKHDPEKATAICGKCGKKRDPGNSRIARGLGVSYALCSDCNTAEY